MHFNLTNVDNVNELDVSIQPPVNDGKLHHFTFSYSGGSNPASVRGWIDKVESVVTTQSNTLSATIVNAGNELRLGRYGADAIRFWKGVIHHISVWDVVFDQSKVNSVYGDGLTRPDLSALSFVANLDAWWKLDDTDVTGASGIADYGPSNIDGTAQGGLGKSAAQIDYWSRFWVRFPFGTHPVVGGGATVGVAVVGTSRMGPIGLDSEAGELYLRTIQTITKRYKPFRWVPWDFEFEYASGKYLRLMGHKRYNDPLYVYQDP
jgi:hypothetical protein